MLCCAMAKVKPRRTGRYVWRDADGQSRGIVVPNPIVKPKSATIHDIRRAVERTTRSKRGSSADHKAK